MNTDGSVADSFTITDGKPFSGMYFVNGAWHYYENGKIGYNKGMIDVDTTWYGADGSETEYSGYIYVRSNGKVATGAYWITNHNGLLPEGMYDFSDDGTLSVN